MENTKKTLGQKIDGLIGNLKAKKDAFKEKHPKLSKGIKATAIIVPVAVGGFVTYKAVQSREDEKKVIEIDAPGTTNMIESGNVDNWEQKRREADAIDWEENKENWSKVLEVADKLDLKDNGDYSDEYHIHCDNEGNVMVAHINDGDYHYPPETSEQKPEEPTQEVEG